MHIVTFDPAGKILQIRQSWDQASLLKQLDIIGKTGRNWPIRDANDQIRLIEASLKASGQLTAAATAAAAEDSGVRGRGNSSNAARDPHAPLALFAPREEIEQQQLASVISPKAGARPRQRNFEEILGDEPVGASGSLSAGRGWTESPSKPIAPKAGSGKNFQANRLFNTERDATKEHDTFANGDSPDRSYRPNPTKYNHFDFADGSDPQDAPIRADPTATKSKHNSQWNFEDFTTPAKARPGKGLQKSHQDVRHWGNEGDDVQESPIRKVAPVKPRKDAETHFEFIDDGMPQGEPRGGAPRGGTHNKELGLYKNNVYSEDGQTNQAGGDDQQALGNITNLEGRGKTFASQFAMTDDSPAKTDTKPQVSQDRQKAVKMMDANWSSYDQSPAQKENKPARLNTSGALGIRTGGDGMGGSKGTDREWMFGEVEQGKADNRGILLGGDGMGGGKGTNRDWLFAEEEEEGQSKAPPTRKQNTAKSAGGGFHWDF